MANFEADIPPDVFGPEMVGSDRALAPRLTLRHVPDGGDLVLRANAGESSTGLPILSGARGTERRQINAADQELPHFRPPTATWQSQVPLYSAQAWQVPPVVTGIPKFGRSVDQFYVPEGEILDLMSRDLMPQPYEATAIVPVPSGGNMQGFGQEFDQQAVAEKAIVDVGIKPSDPWWQQALNVALGTVQTITAQKQQVADQKARERELELQIRAQQAGLTIPGLAPKAGALSSPWVLIPVVGIAAYLIYTQVAKR